MKSTINPSNLSLALLQKSCLLAASFVVVAFGQPVWTWWLGLIASFCGFALFWRVLLSIQHPMKRFFTAMGWFAGVTLVQLAWFAAHPYIYIYAVMFLCAAFMGAQWGLIALWIKPRVLQSIPRLFALAGLWTQLEWLRLFIFTGYPFNPIGLALTGAIYPLQFASLGGIYALSFWVVLTNLFILRLWVGPKTIPSAAWACFFVLCPYIFGFSHVRLHEDVLSQQTDPLKVVLVQPTLPIEENLTFQSAEEARQFVLDEWRQILSTLKKQADQPIDFIVLPEYVVPYGTFHPVFPFDQIRSLFLDLFGPTAHSSLTQNSPYLQTIQTDKGNRLLASNAYIAQTIATLFQAHTVIGLEDSSYHDPTSSKSASYSAAFHFTPEHDNLPGRYEKRVLVPMGEYIPFEWCQKLAADYGIFGSFTPGKGAKIFAGSVPFGISICYEEIFGDMMRENRTQGAELLINLTNDGWYPNSTLPKQHFDHARLRTVENGIPLVRACNTGVTGGFDSLGRVLGTLGGNDHWSCQTLTDSILLTVPKYHYSTPYSRWGDGAIISLSCFCLIGGFLYQRRNSKI